MNTTEQLQQHLASLQDSWAGFAKTAWVMNAVGQKIKFDSLLPGGIKKEGEPPSLWTTSPERAIAFWLVAYTEYCSTRPGKTVWRMEPRLESEDFIDSYGTTQRLWTVYSRLARSVYAPYYKPEPALEGA